MKIIEKLKEIIFKIKDYDRLEYDYCCMLCHATDSRMSKSNYDQQVIRAEIDDAQSRIYYKVVKEDILNILNDGGTIEDVKDYLDRLI